MPTDSVIRTGHWYVRLIVSVFLVLLLAVSGWTQDTENLGVAERLDALCTSAVAADTTLWNLVPDTIPVLIDSLKHGTSSTRMFAALILGNRFRDLGRNAELAIPALADALKDEEWLVRAAVACALGEIGPEAQDAIPELARALRDDIDMVRAAVARTLSGIGPEARTAVPELIEALNDESNDVRLYVAVTLASLAPSPGTKPALPVLIDFLDDEDHFARGYAAMGLIAIGPEAEDAVPALIAVLEDPWSGVRWEAKRALASIGSAAVEALVVALNDENDFVREGSAYALGEIRQGEAHIVDALIKSLDDDNKTVRRASVEALGKICPEPGKAVPALIRIFENASPGDLKTRSPAASALQNIALCCQDGSDTKAIPLLEDALSTLEAAGFSSSRPAIRRAIEALKDKKRANAVRAFQELVRQATLHPWVSRITIYLAVLIALCLIVLWIRPTLLLSINDFLKPFADADLPLWKLGLKLPLRYVLLVGFFHHHPRVLDAWISRHLVTARRKFLNKPTVRQRNVHVELPIAIDGNTIANFKSKDLRATCAGKRWCLLIHGEGGSGKTSLACQIAKWAMSDQVNERPCRSHRMIPILIEFELNMACENREMTLVETVRGQLEDMAEVPVSKDLATNLLRKRRLLVIVDHLSEMSHETRTAIHPGHAGFPIYALVVTSRLQEDLDGIAKTNLRPLRISADRLVSFVNAYLTTKGEQESFVDSDYFEACRNLSVMVGDRDITVLLAKMYLDQMIRTSNAINLPKNIPDLMLGYLNELNRNRKLTDPGDRTVHRVTKDVAWHCLKTNFRPGLAALDDVLVELSSENDAEMFVGYLERKLHIIDTVGAARNLLRFVLDPLAEYLAGLYVIEHNGDSEEKWSSFLNEVDGKPGAPDRIKEFILALRDCILAKGDELGVPNAVAEELSDRAGLEPEMLRQTRLKQRINRLITNLSVPEPEDRRAAIEALGEIGVLAETAIPGIVETLSDSNEDVRKASATSLGKIGSQHEEIVPRLINAFRDPSGDVGGASISALAGIGSPAVPALTAALEDPTDKVRLASAMTLGQIGKAATAAVPALIEALKDANEDVRQESAKTLGAIGLDTEGIVPALIEAFGDPSPEVRFASVYTIALGEILPWSEIVVPALIEALGDPSEDVRSTSAVALGEIGPGANPAVPALLNALRDLSESVRRCSANALSSIGAAAVPALVDTLKDSSEDLRLASAKALRRIGAGAKEAVPALVDALEDTSEDVRFASAEALGEIGPEAVMASRALIDSLLSPNKNIRGIVALALDKIGRGAVPVLIDALKDPNKNVRIDSAWILGRLVSAAEDAVPALQEALEDTNPEVQRHAAIALRQIKKGRSKNKPHS